MRNSEKGSALPVAVGTLLVVSLLAAAVVATSMRSSSDAVTDSNQKRALAAAEAGLQVAVERLDNASSLLPTACLAGSPIGVECPTGTTVDLGNGATATYYVSQQLTSGVTCRSLPGYVPGLEERCVTSIGIANGVQRRVQTRIFRGQAPPIFDQSGMVGRDSVYVDNSNDVDSTIGSNGQITLNNSNKVSGTLLLGPGAPPPVGTNQVDASPATQTLGSPWSFPDPDVPEPVPPTLPNPYANALLSSSYYQAAPANLPKRRFHLDNSATYTMPAGTYNFCEMYLENSVKLTVAGPVKIFIDSPARAGSDCGTQGDRGRMFWENSVEVNKTGDAADFQIYVYGTRNEAANADFRCNSLDYKADVVLCNSGGKAQATIYAPESQVVFDNSVDLTGAVVSETLLLRNSVKFDWPDSVKEIPGFGPRQHEQKAWVECKAKPTNAADPESGC